MLRKKAARKPPRPCKAAGCERRATHRGWCRPCRKRVDRAGLDPTDPDTVLPDLKPGPPRKLTEEQVRWARAKIEAGYTQQSVAETLGVDASTVYRSIQRLERA